MFVYYLKMLVFHLLVNNTYLMEHGQGLYRLIDGNFHTATLPYIETTDENVMATHYTFAIYLKESW
jgi:hypothetical protein